MELTLTIKHRTSWRKRAFVLLGAVAAVAIMLWLIERLFDGYEHPEF